LTYQRQLADFRQLAHQRRQGEAQPARAGLLQHFAGSKSHPREQVATCAVGSPNVNHSKGCRCAEAHFSVL